MISNITPPTVERFGSFTESKFGISSSEDLVYIFDILRSKLYSNKIAAVVREYSTNAADANVENQMRDRPVTITAPTRMSPQFKVRDYGRGLSEDEIRNVYCMYGRSTKRNSNDYTGQLGLGSKSGFAYGDSFTIVSYKDGRKHTYTAYIDETRLGSIAKISESETTEESGIEIVIPVNISDISSFEREIVRAVKYFKVKPNVVNISNLVFQSDQKQLISGSGWTIYEEQSGQYDTRAAVAIMGNIGYPINVQTLTNGSHNINALTTPICIEFSIGELSISANREELEYNDATKKTILNRVKKIEAEVTANAEAKIKSCANIIEARRTYASYNRHLSYIINGKIKWNGVSISSPNLDINTNFCSARLYNPNGKSEIVHQIFLDKTNYRGVDEIFYHDGQRGNYAKMTHHAKTMNKHYVLISFFDCKDPVTGTITQSNDWLKLNHLSSSLFRNASVLPEAPKVIRGPRQKGQRLQNCFFIRDEKSLRGFGTQSENFHAGQCDKKLGGLYIKSDHFFVRLLGARLNAKEFASIIKAFNKVTGDTLDITKIPVFKVSETEGFDDKWTDVMSYMQEKLKGNQLVKSFVQFKSVNDVWEELNSYYGMGVFSKNMLDVLASRRDEFTNKPDILKIIGLWENVKKFMEENKSKSKSSCYDNIKELSRWFPSFAEGISVENEDAASLKSELTHNLEKQYPLLSMIRSFDRNNKTNNQIIDYIVKL
jgi:hypothetical protein